MEKISVIIPVYNAYPYLEKCLHSVVSQTYPNLEILLVNDCSTDKSKDICMKYSNIYNNIKYFQFDRNKGVSYARNFGLDNASGSFIGFVDSDDWIDENMYTVLYHIMKKYDTNIALCNYYLHYQENDIVKTMKTDFIEDMYINDTVETMYFCLANDNVAVWNKLYAKKLFEGIRFPAGKEYEDEHIMHLILEAAGEGSALSKEPLYNYLMRPNSITSKRISVKDFDYIFSTISRHEYLTNKYGADKFDAICRKGIFYSLIKIADRLVQGDMDEILNNKFLEICNQVFSKYIDKDCGLDKDAENGLYLLKTGLIKTRLRNYKVAKSFKSRPIFL